MHSFLFSFIDGENRVEDDFQNILSENSKSNKKVTDVILSAWNQF